MNARAIKQAVTKHRVFSFVFLLMLFVELIRIPLGTFNDSSPIDNMSHFIMPATGAPLLYILLKNAKIVQTSTRLGQWLIIVFIGISAEAVWEVIEFVVDQTFSLNLQPSNADTMFDIILGLVGVATGAWLFGILHRAASDTAQST